MKESQPFTRINTILTAVALVGVFFLLLPFGLTAEEVDHRQDLVKEIAQTSRINNAATAILVVGIGLDIIGPVVLAQGVKRLRQYNEARASAPGIGIEYTGAPAGIELIVGGAAAISVGVPLTIVGATMKARSRKRMTELENTLFSLRFGSDAIGLSFHLRGF